MTTPAQRIYNALRSTTAGLWTWQLLAIADIDPAALARAVRGARDMCRPGWAIEVREVDVDTVTTAGTWRSARYVLGRDYGAVVKPKLNEPWRRHEDGDKAGRRVHDRKGAGHC